MCSHSFKAGKQPFSVPDDQAVDQLCENCSASRSPLSGSDDKHDGNLELLTTFLARLDNPTIDHIEREPVQNANLPTPVSTIKQQESDPDFGRGIV